MSECVVREKRGVQVCLVEGKDPLQPLHLHSLKHTSSLTVWYGCWSLSADAACFIVCCSKSLPQVFGAVVVSTRPQVSHYCW